MLVKNCFEYGLVSWFNGILIFQNYKMPKVEEQMFREEQFVAPFNP